MEESEETFFKLTAVDLMSREAKRIEAKEKLKTAQELMTELKVNSLLVVENEQLVGIVQIYDLGV